MRRSQRAVVFDLDDTLYPRRRFVLSGFAAVARHLDRQHRSGAANVYRVLVEAYRRGDRGRELQTCLAYFDLPEILVPGLVAIMRTHCPALRLPASSRATLRTLRASWRIGVVTNGRPSTQVNKVRALGLQPLVDDVVYATLHGTGRGKPDAGPFLAALSRLGVEPDRAVFVGDDETCDVGGAAAVGLRTIRVDAHRGVIGSPSAADVTVHSVAEVPGVVDTLVPSAWSRNVA